MMAVAALGCCIIHAALNGHDPVLAGAFAVLAYLAGAVLTLASVAGGNWPGVLLGAMFCGYWTLAW
jgi:hypothetical protein